MKNPNIFYPPKPPEHNLYDYWQWPGVFDKKDLDQKIYAEFLEDWH